MRLKMLKNVTAFLLAILFVTGSVYANDEVVVTKNNRNITVEIDADPGSMASMYVVKHGLTYENKDNVYAMEQVETNVDGKAIFTFIMPDMLNSATTDGEYDIYAKQNGFEMRKGYFAYATPQRIKELEEELARASKLSDFINNSENKIALTAIGFFMNEYDELNSGKDEVIAITETELPSLSTVKIGDVEKAFNLAVAVKLINNGSQSDIESILDKSELSFEDVLYSDITSADIKTWIANRVYEGKDYTTVAALKSIYTQANCLYVINNTRYTKMTDVLNHYSDALGLTGNVVYNSYLSLSEKGPTNNKIAAALSLKPATTSAQLIQVIKDAVPTAQNNGGGNGGGSNGGSSGGSSGGVSFTDPTVKNENEQLNPSLPFNDLESAEWAKEAIVAMAEKGVVSGDENGNFRPNDILKREEFVKMLTVACGVYDKNAKCNFDDVPADAWYAPYVASAKNSGLVNGVSETEFGVGSYLTRQDMTVICYRALMSTKEIVQIKDAPSFADSDIIAAYAKDAVFELYKAGVVNGIGDNKFDPLGTATRAQGVQMLYNIFLK